MAMEAPSPCRPRTEALTASLYEAVTCVAPAVNKCLVRPVRGLHRAAFDTPSGRCARAQAGRGQTGRADRVVSRHIKAGRVEPRASDAELRPVQHFMGRLSAILVFACAASPAVLAQDLPPPLPTPPTPAPTVMVDQGRVFGDDAPFASGLDVLAGFGFNISAGLRTEYNDNIRRLEDDAIVAPGASRSDFRFTPTVAVSAGRSLGRQQIFLNAGLGRDFYVRNTILDKNRVNVGGGLAWRLGQRCNGRVQGSWRKRGTQFDSFAEVIPSTQETVSFFTSATCQTAGRLVGSASYSRSNTKNRTDSSQPDFLDRSFANVNSDSINASVAYALTRGQVGVSGNWGNFDYPNQILLNGETNGTSIQAYNVFANYRIGTSLQANASVGHSKVDPKSPFAQEFSGNVWNVGLNYSGPRLGGSIGAGRSVNGSSGGNSNFSIGKFYSMDVNYKANDRLSAAAGYRRSSTEYRGVLIIPGTQPINDAELDRFFVGTDYRLNRLLTFGLDLNHQKRSSNPGTFSYDATAVIFNMRASF